MANETQYEQLLGRLVEAPDPPLPVRVSRLTKMSEEDARKSRITMVVIAVVLGAGAALLWRYGHPIWSGVLGFLAALCGVLVFSPRTLVASCPFCGNTITGLLEDTEQQELQCEKCFEYSVQKRESVRPLDPAAVSEVPRFECPAFEGARWPKACVACGAPPTRLDDLAKSSVNAAMLVVGRLKVMKGSVEGVPYCDAHRDNLEIVVKQDRSIRLRWCSLRMMRRYVALNRRGGRR
jgi:hypothetical protein